MRNPLKRPRPDERPRRRRVSDTRLQAVRRQAWLESSRPTRINL